jgi:hypothetical protein
VEISESNTSGPMSSKKLSKTIKVISKKTLSWRIWSNVGKPK